MRPRTKYPRTMNLPWSDSETSDDVWWKDTDAFHDMEVVITEKMDGECTTIYSDGFVHARSVDSQHHPSRSWIKALAAGICHRFSSRWRVCGENMFAWHSIFYTELPTYFFIYGVYDGDDYCLHWEEVEEVARMLDLPTVPVLWKGWWDEFPGHDEFWTGQSRYPTFSSTIDPNEGIPQFPDDFEPCNSEGYVIRRADDFRYGQFARNCAKYVRPNHVQTTSNWMQREVIKNQLRQEI